MERCKDTHLTSRPHSPALPAADAVAVADSLPAFTVLKVSWSLLRDVSLRKTLLPGPRPHGTPPAPSALCALHPPSPLIFFLAPAHTLMCVSCAFLGLFILSMRAEAASSAKKSVHMDVLESGLGAWYPRASVVPGM